MKHEQHFYPGGEHDPASDLVALVQSHAQLRPDQLAYVFLEDGEREGARLTFAGLDRRARAIAAELQRHIAPRSRALLLFPPGLDYIEAFFGCLYAGVVAVPAYPPSGRHLQRLRAIVDDAAPSIVLSTHALCERFSQDRGATQGVAWRATDTLASDLAERWRPLFITPEDIAFLQYTSGSTGDPRGVMVSHGNLIANEALIKASFHHDENSTLVGWLPLYHDMGLIGNILQPLYAGATAYLMSPTAFLEKPARWLTAISKYSARTSGGPNFGYEHCIRKILPQEKKELDLSSWRIAFSGAEPVRAATLDRFADAFAECGFRKQSFYPCYGLAEATLVVSAPSDIRETPVRRLDRSALERRSAVANERDGLDTVGCGHLWPAHDVRIVEPNEKTECRDGQIGEIWVAGPGVAKGYWRRDVETERYFRARLVGDESPRDFLRTGDLGFLDRGELYVTGRLKDLIIIGGRNYYPHDIEGTIESAVAGLRPGGTTAVPMSDGDTESFVVLAEPRRADLAELRRNGGKELIQSIRATLADAIDIAPYDIVLLKPGSTPKTSSGKTRRAECRRAYLAGEFDVLARSAGAVVEPAPCGASRASEPLLRRALEKLTPDQREPLITQLLIREAARLLRVPEDEIDAGASVSRCGLDSLRSVELRHAIEQALGLAPPLAILLSDSSLEEVARAIGRFDDGPASDAPVLDRRLSCSQQAMWAAQQLDAESIIYNLHLALDVGAIDAAKFRAALDDTFAAHDQLRTLYHATESGAEMIEKEPGEYSPALEIVDARIWDAAGLQADFGRRAAEPFDLETDLPLRVTLYRNEGRDALLFVAHHIAMDLWSLLLFISELDARYRGVALDARGERYATFSGRQRQYLETARAEDDWRYWREQLDGELPALRLRRDYSSCGAPGYAGASKALRVDAKLTAALLSLARREDASLFSVLLTAYFILLARHTGQRDIIIGAPTSGRLDRAFAQTIGNFVNPVAIRATIAPDATAQQVLRDVHERVRGALAHQEFPLPVLVDRLRPAREGDRWPIYQTTFVLQQSQSGLSQRLSLLALGEDAGALDILGGEAHVRAISQRVESSELKLMAAKDGDSLLISFQYRTDCFADTTIERLAHHFVAILDDIANNIEKRVAALSLLSGSEHRQIIEDWNDTFVQPRDKDALLHEAFERCAVAHPNRIALSFDGTHLTYEKLNARANRLAHHLHDRYRVGPDRVVAICAERSIELVIALLAVLKAGGAYLPLDCELPEERLALMIADASPTLILTQKQWREKLDVVLALGAAPNVDEKSPAPLFILDDAGSTLESAPANNLVRSALSENLAYLIYTSGSTGQPKAVASVHRGIVNRLDWMQDRYRLSEDDVVLQKTPCSFDVSVWEFFWPLREGGRLVIAPPSAHRDPGEIAAIVTEERVTTLHFVPSMLQAFLATPTLTATPSLRRVICSGEALSAALRDAFFVSMTGELHNLYGPTEASIDVSAFACLREDAADDVRIGRPIWNTQLYILNEALAPVPAGATGELYIGGVGLARGYLNRSDLTAERFVPNPFRDDGERLYRTGDLARYRNDGNIEFLGRIDHQVKIRGFRIELAEIESALLNIDGVASAVVIARDYKDEGPGLVAYVISDRTACTGPIEIRQSLARKIPDYMIPGAIVLIDALPLTASGKVDRKALPAPTIEVLRQYEYVAPRTYLETRLAHIWEEVLGWDRVGLNDNFFDVGGDSIRAIQIANRLSRDGVHLRPRQIFQNPTIGSLAYSLHAEKDGSVAPCGVETPVSTEPFAYSRLEEVELAEVRVTHRDAQDIYRLTPLQEGMLLYTLAQKGAGVYHLQERYHFNGALDVDTFFDAWRRVVARHDTLRTSFHLDRLGRPYQLVHSSAELECRFTDISGLAPDARTIEIDRYLQRALERGFDMTHAPLLRIHVLKLASDLHLCVREFHHIILDDWCTSPLMLDVRNHYAARLRGEYLDAAPPPQFRDYVAWLGRRHLSAAQSFWTRYLAGFAEPTPLVIAKAGETAAVTVVEDVFAEFPSRDFSRLKDIAREHRVTINTFVQAAVGLLLCRYAGAKEAVFGVTVAGRPAELMNSDETLGLFINGLPLRVKNSPEKPVLDWLKSLLADNVEMRQHEFVSQSAIQQWSEIPRADALLFQHLLTFENAPIDQRLVNDRSIFDISLAGLRVHTNYPITFVAIPGESLAIRITYDRNRFDRGDMERMILHWRLLIGELARNIDGVVADLAPLEEMEKRQVTLDWNRTDRDYGAPLDLVARFEAQAAENGSAIAAACLGKTLTFAAINERANRLAHALIERGFGADDIIAIFEERGLDFLTSILAIFKCGAGYLPIDPAYPDRRIASVLNEAHVSAVLAGEAHFARAGDLTPTCDARSSGVLRRQALESASLETDNPPKRYTSRSVAFVIYTSGSTGKPKGALVEHRGMFNNLITKVPALGLTPDDVIAQTASQCFDISVWQFLLGLAIGARVEILPDEISRDPDRLVEAIQRRGITILESVPSMIRALMDAAHGKSLGGLRWLIPCGEAFTPELCRRVMAEHPSLRLLNAYGPAECSDDVTYFPVAEPPAGNELSIPIGRPVDNCRIYVLDRWFDPAPIGAPGEICVAGIQVGRGYLHRADLTANVFRPDPFGPPGSLLYRTGDLGRWQANGMLDFLGRVDHQVKIRGHRVEPGEIEACLVTHPKIEEACVLPIEIDKGDCRLVAYVVGTEREAAVLRAHLSRTLPDFMLPSFFVFLDRMPLSSNGKIDRRRLPLPDAGMQRALKRTAPRTPTEVALCEIWKELLGVSEIGVEDNFFELGGHSLLAIQLRSRIQSAFDVETPLTSLFNNTTVEGLARQIEDLILAEIEAMSEAQAEQLRAQYAD